MKRMTKDERFLSDTLDKAFAAAKKACDDYLTKYPDNWFPCGFAWVKFPGRSPAVKALKEMKVGSKGYPKGYDVWDPARSSTQCMEAKYSGAKAFANVMNDAGYECHADCRMD
jgi:hypothetical protein